MNERNVFHLMKSVGFLLLFLLAFPLTLFITLITLISSCFIRQSSSSKNTNGKRILISGGGMTKSLQLARSFHAAGHYVVLTDEYSYATHRYSRCVSRFYLSADSDRVDECIQSIVDIVKREQIEIFLPVSHSSNECLDGLIKQALIPFHCQTLHADFEQLQMLSNKQKFTDYARSCGLNVPKSFYITDPNQILTFDFSQEKRSFILKSLHYNSVARTNLVQLPCATRKQTIEYINSLIINEQSPWIMQEYLHGKEYCTHGMIRHGLIQVYACCPSSSWLLNYKHLNNKPEILQWVKEFSAHLKLTGQASFDFIQSDDDGLIYALECNPRTHTAITTFYNQPLLAQGYLEINPNPIEPMDYAREIYWLYHELWNLLHVRKMEDFIRIMKLFLYGKEAIYSFDDPWPFFLHYSIHMPRLIVYHTIHMKFYNTIDCNLALLL